ncbi:MATE family efflux transporter [Labrys monachus]|uniref:MATE family efflux protein n=1 Tax=Labrys monachus TaxID=217067 RepID=A0ABU0FAC1_9HYPH|nr:MATE family efflux transporter [Labrys monachus]MDQ0391564.1 putative MATE family efflux protein [Labrys monachus]
MDHPQADEEAEAIRAAPRPPVPQAQAKFVTGSTMRHVVVMTSTGSIGLMAVFAVDLINLWYISHLGDTVATAAVGYASTILFMTTSVCIGIMISAGALCSRALGGRNRPLARRFAASTMVWMLVVTTGVALCSFPFIRPILAGLGATGRTLDLATIYLQITTPTVILIGIGVGFSGVLRAVGDARRAMYVTLSGAIVAAILDPVFILWLGLGVEGAACVVVFSRAALALLGWYGAVRVHGLVARLSIRDALADFIPIIGIAGPAVLANLATPVANSYMTAVLAPFGDGAVAGNAVTGRLVAFCFGGIFSLSGVVGPIFGQNYGAGRLDRVRRTLTDAFIFTTIYALVMWAVLAAGHHGVVRLFNIVDPEAARLIEFFCLFVAGSWIFHGLLFVANASFNNLGFPIASTIFNWGKTTLGTIPFALAGATLWGAEGALAGQGLGAVLFGVIGVWWAYRSLRRLKGPKVGPAPARAASD